MITIAIWATNLCAPFGSSDPSIWEVSDPALIYAGRGRPKTRGFAILAGSTHGPQSCRQTAYVRGPNSAYPSW